MEYTINQVATLAHISTRTLRYYDEIALLKPAKLNKAGYRIYTTHEIDRLQQILFYRTLDLPLETIKQLLDDATHDIIQDLSDHYNLLRKKQNELAQQVALTKQTIAYYKGEKQMTDTEKFKAFKAEKIAENEAQFGKELKEKYSDRERQQATATFANLTEEQFNTASQLEETLIATLKSVLDTPEKFHELAPLIFDTHKNWLQIFSATYSAAYHRNLAAMYLADARFTAYYDDKAGIGATKVLQQAIALFTK